MNNYYKFLLAAAVGCQCMAASAQNVRYDDWGEGRAFFTDGQEWTYKVKESDPVAREYNVTARVLGDSAIISYTEMYGDIYQVQQPCKSLAVISDLPDAKEKRYAIYEWDAEIYVFSEKKGDFVELLNYWRGEGSKYPKDGVKWTIECADYIYPQEMLLKRYHDTAEAAGREQTRVYHIGADRFWIEGSNWEGAREYEFASYTEPGSGHQFDTAVFDAETFVADNLFYPDGKHWVYRTDYKDMESVRRHTIVEGDEEYAHVNCKKLSIYRNDSTEAEEYTYGCSKGDRTFARGYMKMLQPQYDFTLQKGDKVTINESPATVTDVDLIEVDGKELRRITFERNVGRWVEGIGGDKENSMIYTDEFASNRAVSFEECSLGDDVIFHAEDFDAATVGISSIAADAAAPTAKGIYNLDGISIDKARKGAIVIIDGKAHLCK